MKVFLPDKDSLFFLRDKQVSFIKAFNASAKGILYPVLPLVFIPPENFSFENFASGFRGCEYSGFYEKDGRIFIRCTFSFGNKTECLSSQTAVLKQGCLTDDKLLQEFLFSRKARIIRTEEMSGEKNSWSFSDEKFYSAS